MHRSEVEEISEIVKNTAHETFGDNEWEIMTCGSYRRGREMCGDVDMIFSRIDCQDINGYLIRLVDKLFEIGFMIENLGSTDTMKKYRKK